MGVLTLLGACVLVAAGWAHAFSFRHGRPVAIALGLLATLEAWPVGMGRGFSAAPVPPPSAEWLARAPAGPVLYAPWHDGGVPYILWSTKHWLPTVNGLGSFMPPGARVFARELKRWPSPEANEALRWRGVRYLVVNLDYLGADERERLPTADVGLPNGARLAADLGVERVYELGPPIDR
jgi:hypothetical protein